MSELAIAAAAEDVPEREEARRRSSWRGSGASSLPSSTRSSTRRSASTAWRAGSASSSS